MSLTLSVNMPLKSRFSYCLNWVESSATVLFTQDEGDADKNDDFDVKCKLGFKCSCCILITARNEVGARLCFYRRL